MKLPNNFLAGITALICALFAADLYGQTNPELELMYNSAENYRKDGNKSEAIRTYTQLLRLAPGHASARLHLAMVHHAASDYNAEETTLEPAIKEKLATDSIYYQMVLCQLKQSKYKFARQCINEGINKYPESGLMYFGAGQVETMTGKKDKAQEYFVKGKSVAPLFAPTIKALSVLCMEQNDHLWGIFYGQAYLSMQHDTSGDQELKKLLFANWKLLFQTMSNKGTSGLTAKATRKDALTSKMLQMLEQLSPVVSEGVTTETITMVTARLLIDLKRQKVNSKLMEYQYQVMQAGLLDQYCEYLYGKAESVAEYEAWNIFHSMEMARLKAWMEDHPLGATD